MCESRFKEVGFNKRFEGGQVGTVTDDSFVFKKTELSTNKLNRFSGSIVIKYYLLLILFDDDY